MCQLPTTGAIKNGPRYVYNLWRGLIDTWLGYPMAVPGLHENPEDSIGHVYIISPLIDSKRLADVLLLLIKHRLTSCRLHIYTMQRCSGEDGKFERVFKDAKEMVRGIRDPTTKRRAVVEERLRQALTRIDIRFGRFQTKMVAYHREDYAELLLTSANFHAWNFAHENSDSVCYLRLPSSDLKQSYLTPLGLLDGPESNGTAMMHLETSSISGMSEISHSLSYQPSECSSSSSMHEGLEGIILSRSEGVSSSTLHEEQAAGTLPIRAPSSDIYNTNNMYATIGSNRSSYRSGGSPRTVEVTSPAIDITGQGGGVPTLTRQVTANH